MIYYRDYFVKLFSICFTLLNYNTIVVSGQAAAVSFASANGLASSASSSSSVGLGVPGVGSNFGVGHQGNNIFQQLNTNLNQFIQPNFPIIPQPIGVPNIAQNILRPQNFNNALFYNGNNMNLNNNFPNKNGKNGGNPAQRPNQNLNANNNNNNRNNIMKPNNNNNNSNNNNNKNIQKPAVNRPQGPNTTNNNINKNINNINNGNKNSNNSNNNNNKNTQKPVINRPQGSNPTKPITQPNSSNNSNKKPKPIPNPTTRPRPNSTKPDQRPNQTRPTEPQSNFNGNAIKNTRPTTKPKPQPNASNNKPSSPTFNQGGSPTLMIQSPNPEFGGNIQSPNKNLNKPQYPNWNTQSPNINIPNTDVTPLPPMNSNDGNLISGPAEIPLFNPVPQLRPSEAIQLPPTTKEPYTVPGKLQPGIIMNPDSPYFVNKDIEEPSLLIDIRSL